MADEKSKSRQIKAVMKEEGSRGRRSPAQIEAQRERDLFSREIEKHRTTGTEATFLAAMRELRPGVDSETLQQWLLIFREIL